MFVLQAALLLAGARPDRRGAGAGRRAARGGGGAGARRVAVVRRLGSGGAQGCADGGRDAGRHRHRRLVAAGGAAASSRRRQSRSPCCCFTRRWCAPMRCSPPRPWPAACSAGSACGACSRGRRSCSAWSPRSCSPPRSSTTTSSAADDTGIARSLPVFDLAGIAHFAGPEAVPLLPPETWRAMEARRCYQPFFWDPLADPDHCQFVQEGFEDAAEGPDLFRLWAETALRHPWLMPRIVSATGTRPCAGWCRAAGRWPTPPVELRAECARPRRARTWRRRGGGAWRLAGGDAARLADPLVRGGAGRARARAAGAVARFHPGAVGGHCSRRASPWSASPRTCATISGRCSRRAWPGR